MKTVLAMLFTVLVAAGQSPTQHVTQGDLEIYTAPYSSPVLVPDEVRQYGLGGTVRIHALVISVFTEQSGIAAFRIELDVTLEGGEVVHVDQSQRTFAGTMYLLGPFKSSVVGIAHLRITKQREDDAVEVPLVTEER